MTEPSVQERRLGPVQIVPREPGESPKVWTVPSELTLARHPEAEIVDRLEIVGTIVDGRYLVERPVGCGGFGIVYRARHLRFDSPVALKVLHRAAGVATDPAAPWQRFLDEGKLLFGLAPLHPSLVRVLEAGTLPTRAGVAPYLALEWLDGVTLKEELVRQRAAGRRLSLSETLLWLDPIAGGLSVAHARRIAHRDVKPANIFLSLSDTKVVPKILDFGLAKAMTSLAAEADAFGDSELGPAPFTPAYGAPEQWSRRLGATGAWTDVYSFALVCVELLAGRRALSGNGPPELMHASLDDAKRPTPKRLGVDVTDAVDRVFERALAVDPRRRYPSAEAFWRELGAAADWAGGRGVPIELTETAGAPGGPSGETAAEGTSRPTSRSAPVPVDAGWQSTRRKTTAFAVLTTLLLVIVAVALTRTGTEQARRLAAPPNVSATSHGPPVPRAPEPAVAEAPPPGPISPRPSGIPASTPRSKLRKAPNATAPSPRTPSAAATAVATASAPAAASNSPSTSAPEDLAQVLLDDSVSRRK